MSFTVIGEPTQAVVDAISAKLRADAQLAALVGTRIYAHVPETARPAFPYIVLGRRGINRDVGPMVPAGIVSLELDAWSDYDGPYEMAQILSRVSALLERASLQIPGYHVLEGSLTAEMSEVGDEPDEDMANRRLYRGIQRWIVEVHQAA